MVRWSLVAALFALLVGGAAPAGAQTQTTAVIDETVAGLQAAPIYVHADAADVISSDEVAQLREQVAGADAGPVYIAVLPDSAVDAAGGSPDGVLRLIGEGVNRTGTYAVVVGRRFRAGATDGTPFEDGTVPAVASAAAEESQGEDVATLLTNFVAGLEAAAANGGRVPSDGLDGVGFVPVLLVGGLGFLGYRALRRRKQEREQLEEIRRVAEEDLTTLGNEIYDLEREFTMPGAHPGARSHYDQAVMEYQEARNAMALAQRPSDLSKVTEPMERGRFAVACVKAALAGQPLPVHRPPCFFAPSHGPSTRDVEWAPDGGGERRPVPACEADAQRVERGEEPDSRLITVGGQRRPYWEAPPWYGGYYGGYYGGFGGLGFLQGMLWGSMFGGGFGWGGGFGDTGDTGGAGDFGDFGGGGFGGGDFGGGDFGGGDF
jgi:hypothetical protein